MKRGLVALVCIVGALAPSSVVTADIIEPADLAIDVSFEPPPFSVLAGRNIRYTIEVSNEDTADAEDAVATFNLDADTTFKTATAGCTHDAGVVTCTVGDLAAGDSKTKDVVVATRVSSIPYNIQPFASVEHAGADPEPTNNSIYVTYTVARPPIRPGATIGLPNSDDIRGHWIYNKTARNQTLNASIAPGGTRKFWIQVRNDGFRRDVIGAEGCASSGRFRVAYFHGAATVTGNVTAEVVNGTFETWEQTAGSWDYLTLRITALDTAVEGSTFRCDVQVDSGLDPSFVDVVRAAVTVRSKS